MVASASRERVISPATTWAINSLTISFPRSRTLGSRPSLPSSTILSSKLPSAALAGAGCAAAAVLSDSVIGSSLILVLSLTYFFLQAVQILCTPGGFHQQLVQLVVALQSTPQIAQLGPQIEQFLERFYLLSNLRWIKVVQALKIQVNFELAGIGVFAEFIVNSKGQVRFETLQYTVKVIRRDFHKPAVLQPRERFSRLTAQVGHHTHDKWEFLRFDRVPNLYVVSDMNAGRTDTFQLLMHTFFGHGRHLSGSGLGGRWFFDGKSRCVCGIITRSESCQVRLAILRYKQVSKAWCEDQRAWQSWNMTPPAYP